ncbi:DUF4430 domain-containing protein [Paramaledivibacter caminithermalis]|jgi:hypothetical protein|uniref:Transcobalamin-like C-terminal domain-containing protein n=1 Tax=Paramaledivibacter caminithermalis (strain DSM 15212 / CIP 107654 / DViRD3) TaxID=1121301 RepID=A0A1M6MVK0_PARC5|nr:DUF4430 domain-containing protein [Paramaledivibacter caminithermalis]SHJ87477.1 protein of unknown function [Paramaledivibacter caminithermalis DSM 15212]
MMKKVLSMLMVTVMILTVLAVPAFADDGCTTYPYVTLDDSNDFTIVGDVSNTQTIKAVGLDSSWSKHDFTAIEKQYLTWTTSDSEVVKFVSGPTTVTSKTGVDQVTIKTMGQGTATVTVTYDTPDDAPVTVTSYVVVEGSTVTNSVSEVNIVVDGVSSDDFTMTFNTVPLFDLSDAGICTNDNDVLKKTPSAIHALLYALEIYYSDETTSTAINNFDWNWVKKNVTIESEGSYVSRISNDTNDYSNGWQFEVNSSAPNHAASVIPLSDNDGVTWKFKQFSW